MDLNNEDRMVQQIESNLADRNDNLFHSGKIVIKPERRNDAEVYSLVAGDVTSETPYISRAEYIRQARESCLKQLSNVQLYSKAYDVNYMEQPLSEENIPVRKKLRMFQEDTRPDMETVPNVQEQMNSYRSLIVRCICAIILFLSIFAFDKFDIKVGTVSKQVIKEYVTGNDFLKDIENIIVGWLK